MGLQYRVDAFRDAGLEAKWTKVRGAPMLVVRNPQATTKHQRNNWWVCDNSMFDLMGQVGIVEGFDQHTLLGDMFSI